MISLSIFSDDSRSLFHGNSADAQTTKSDGLNESDGTLGFRWRDLRRSTNIEDRRPSMWRIDRPNWNPWTWNT